MPDTGEVGALVQLLEPEELIEVEGENELEGLVGNGGITGGMLLEGGGGGIEIVE